MEWRGYGTESGTLEKVYLEGTSAEDIRLKALGRAYPVNLHMIWRVKPEAAE